MSRYEYNKKWHDEKKMRLNQRCIDCGNLILFQSTRCKSCAGKGELNHEWGATMSPEQKQRLKEGRGDQLGENNPRYIDGKANMFRQMRKLEKYKQWRSDVYSRDKWTCQTCGEKGNLHAHHIKCFITIVRDNNILNTTDAVNCFELWDVNNGVTLCAVCHARVPHDWIKEVS